VEEVNRNWRSGHHQMRTSVSDHSAVSVLNLRWSTDRFHSLDDSILIFATLR
jgi:hypothetical protein